MKTGTGPGPLCCWCLGPVQVPTLSISWHQPAPPPRQQNLLCEDYFLCIYVFFFKRNYLPTWSSALRENRANSLIEGSCATGHFLMRGCKMGPCMAAGEGWQPLAFPLTRHQGDTRHHPGTGRALWDVSLPAPWRESGMARKGFGLKGLQQDGSAGERGG